MNPEDLKKLTDSLRHVQTLVGIAVPLGGTLIGLVRAGVDALGNKIDQKTRDEALALAQELEDFFNDLGTEYRDWLASHPAT